MALSSSPVPIAALIGRTNTGKSRLYNALCGRPEALVSDREHLTRDWRETRISFAGAACRLRDTAGLTEASDTLSRMIVAQTRAQIDEADVLLFLVDARAGLQALDREYAKLIRRSGKPVVLVINKMDTTAGRRGWAEFAELGFADSALISAERHEGLDDLASAVAAGLDRAAAADPARQAPESAGAAPAAGPADAGTGEDAAQGLEAPESGDGDPLNLVICGISNSGKSTLINRLTRSDRLLVHSEQGTTREPVGQSLSLGGQRYRIYDTCGFVRRGDILQYLADSKTDRLIDRADLVVYMIDSTRGVVRADLRKLAELIEAGQNPLVVCSKSDLVDTGRRQLIEDAVGRQLAKLGFDSRIVWVSSHKGKGLKALARKLGALHEETGLRFATSRLTRILHSATDKRPPPTIDSRRIRLRYAHQGGTRPLLIIVHGKQTSQLSNSYQRYLAKTFRDELGLRLSIPRVIFSTDDNPYAKAIRG